MSITIYRDDDARAIFIQDANGVQFLNALHVTVDLVTDLVSIQDVSKEILLVADVEHSEFLNNSGSTYGSTSAEVCNNLNTLFQAVGSTGDVPVITSNIAVSMTQGDTLNYELTADYGVGYEWSGLPSGLVTVEGNVRKLVGGSTLTAGVYTPTVKAINYFGEDEQTITITVASPAYNNTKAIRFSQSDFLNAVADVANPLYRASNGTGSSDAWSVSFWFKGGGNANAEQTILSFGGNDKNNEGHVWVRWDASGGDDLIMLRYGTDNNKIVLKTPPDSVANSDPYQHFLITYDGGTTGSSSGDINDYYSRFKIFINDVEQILDKSHANNGFNGEIQPEFFRVGEACFGGRHLRNGCLLDELALWSSDESANSSLIYSGGATHDLALLASPPAHYWRMGDGDTYPTLQDTIGALDFTMNNMTVADIINDVP